MNNDVLSPEAQQQYEDLVEFQQRAADQLANAEKMFEPILGKESDAKIIVYELQKEINEYDYKMSQDEIRLKKLFDDQTKELKEKNEVEFQKRFDEIEEMRN